VRARVRVRVCVLVAAASHCISCAYRSIISSRFALSESIRYKLSRIQLPDYKETCHATNVSDSFFHPLRGCSVAFADKSAGLFSARCRSAASECGPAMRILTLQEAGEGVNTCDFPQVFLEKAMWAGLSEYAPPVADLMKRFVLEEKMILEIEELMDKRKLGVVSAVCKWMKENQPVWEAWLPPSRYWVECELGEIVVGKSCQKCPAGTFSNEQYATECIACAPGDAAP
jgi:hypothetical protein